MRHPTTSLRDAAGTPPSALLRVVKGDPTAEEVAALVVALASRQRAVTTEPTRSEWARPRPRAALPPPGPHAWRLSSR